MPLLPDFVCVDEAGNWLSVRIDGGDYGVIPRDGQKTAADWRAEYHKAGQLPLPPSVTVMVVLPPGAEELPGVDMIQGTINPSRPIGPPLVARDGQLVEKEWASEIDAWKRRRGRKVR